MQDEEYRLRHRYLDLTYTPQTLERALKRVKIVRRIRAHLDAQGYVEVETPTLHAIAGGAAARPFTTHHNALDIDLFLRIALELQCFNFKYFGPFYRTVHTTIHTFSTVEQDIHPSAFYRI